MIFVAHALQNTHNNIAIACPSVWLEDVLCEFNP